MKAYVAHVCVTWRLPAGSHIRSPVRRRESGWPWLRPPLRSKLMSFSDAFSPSVSLVNRRILAVSGSQPSTNPSNSQLTHSSTSPLSAKSQTIDVSASHRWRIQPWGCFWCSRLIMYTQLYAFKSGPTIRCYTSGSLLLSLFMSSHERKMMKYWRRRRILKSALSIHSCKRTGQQ